MCPAPTSSTLSTVVYTYPIQRTKLKTPFECHAAVTLLESSRKKSFWFPFLWHPSLSCLFATPTSRLSSSTRSTCSKCHPPSALVDIQSSPDAMCFQQCFSIIEKRWLSQRSVGRRMNRNKYLENRLKFHFHVALCSSCRCRSYLPPVLFRHSLWLALFLSSLFLSLSLSILGSVWVGRRGWCFDCMFQQTQCLAGGRANKVSKKIIYPSSQCTGKVCATL
jgi:hypothetical protein